MRVVFISRRGNRKAVDINSWAKVLLSLCMLGLPVGAGVFLGIQLSGGKVGFLLENAVDNLKTELADQRRELADSEAQSQRQVEAFSLKLAEMQARLDRLQRRAQTRGTGSKEKKKEGGKL